MGWLEASINKQRDHIVSCLREPMTRLAEICQQQWSRPEQLDAALKQFLVNKPDHHCRLIYAIDITGKQYSSNVSDEMVDRTIIGQNLAQRPYLQSLRERSSDSEIFLSEVYIDKQTRKPCITLLHLVRRDDMELGYIAADFGLQDLQMIEFYEVPTRQWTQIKGDPSIRGGLFLQHKIISEMDRHIDEVLDVVESLITEQGIFHAKLHFSSSRATLWTYVDPYHYRLHVLDEIIDPDVCLVYARMPYPVTARVPSNRVRSVLRGFKILREADDVIYLRSASLNIMNGLVGLNFSCDGTHYMPADEFLEKDLGFWFGDSGQAAAC